MPPPDISIVEVRQGPQGDPASVTAANVQTALAAAPEAARDAMNGLSFLNVRDYGATGDGVTDDTVAIQAAITALEASTTINEIHFPRGTYILDSSVADTNTNTSSFRNLLLGTADLAGRDIKITGEPGAVIRQTLGTQRTHMLVAKASFRSLTFEGIRFEKDSTPLSATAGEPNGNDAVALVRVDTREIELVRFEKCVFWNLHGACFAYRHNFDARGKLKRFDVLNCDVINPYGANTVNSAASFGGGQQFYLSPWIHTATYLNNLFEGASADISDAGTAPGGKVKDAAHFGAPMHLVFKGNTVKRFGVEAVYVTGTHNFLGTTSAGFTVPTANGVTTATVTLAASTTSSGGPGTITVGMDINIQVDSSFPYETGRFKVTAYDAGTRTITFVNNGPAGNIAAGTLVSTDKFVYLDAANDATAIFEGNTLDNTPPTGAWASTTPYGIVTSVRSTIQNNVIRGNYIGIYSYPVLSTPSVDQSKGTLVQGNHITTLDAATYTTEYTYGLNVRTSGWRVIGNTVVAPTGRRLRGINFEMDGYAAGNFIYPLVPEINGYIISRTVGLSVGNSSTGCVFEGNTTSGLDVGIGPSTASANIPMTVRSHTTSSDVLPIDNIANITLPKTGYQDSPQFSAYLSANQSHAGSAYEKVRFNTEEFDTASAYDNATNYRFQPLVKGRYLITAGVGFENISSGSTIAWQIRKTGAVLRTVVSENVNPTSNYSRPASAIVDMNGSSDYIEIHAFQNTGTRNILGGATTSFFSASRLP